MRAWLALVIGTVATPATAADQFDLICTGGKAPIRYRVDLARGEACEGSCDRIWKMGPATSGELKLIDKVPAYRGDLEERATVNRMTGEYEYTAEVNGKAHSRTGRCAGAPFSRFPSQRF